MKRILSIVCAIALALSLVVMPANTQAATAKKYAYFTVETTTIGQGFFVQPTKVELKDGDKVVDVFKRVMSENKKEYFDGTGEYGWYLTGIKNADAGTLNIPSRISAMEDYGTAKAPSNENNTGNAAKPDLSAMAYHDMSGWMFMINNASASAGADSLLANDGDVIRLQFSVYAYGADLGFDYGEYNVVTPVKVANKDALIKKVADVKDDKAYMSIAAAKKAYEDGIKVLENYDATDAEVKTATETIEKYQKQEGVTVAQAKIKSIKNIKGKKAKITVKKMKDATGYVFKYSKYKSLKKAKKVTTKKTYIKTKKFKKKQRCYAKVRAYKVVNKVKFYGQWSKRKSVKIRK